jgi:DeoR family transcriptional regulator of aga operon
MIAERGHIDVAHAVAELDASPATIRRDLAYLDKQHLATRTRGGATVDRAGFDLPLHLKSQQAADEKRRIAKRAAELVPLGSVVAVNGGTTILEVVRSLSLRADLASFDGPDQALTVVTNAVNVASELVVRPFIKVVVIGGVARQHSYELYGPLADRAMEQLYVDIALMGVNGFDPEFGASAFSDAEASVNYLFARRARKVIIVADSSKLGERAFAQICAPSQVHTLVTDSKIDPEMHERIQHLGIEVHVV